MRLIDWVKKCSKLYFKITGESPDQSFWDFVGSCGIEESNRAFKDFYFIMPELLRDEDSQ